jgi:hypothetical protein
MELVSTRSIPKIIHYCWFGGNRKPKLVKDCILSWKKHFPDYQIIEWNEKNSDLTHPFVAKVYKQKKWAFVSDYIRLQKIYEFGGIYLDTDMLIIKGFEVLLNNDCFLGAENSDFISVGVIGANRKNEFIKECKEIYDSLIIEENMNFGEITIPKLITKKYRTLFNYEFDFDKIVVVDKLTIYPAFFFYPLPFEKKADINNYKNYINKDTYAIHLWSSSWIQYSEFHYLRSGKYFRGFQIYIKDFSVRKIKISYLRKIASCIKESLTK